MKDFFCGHQHTPNCIFRFLLICFGTLLSFSAIFVFLFRKKPRQSIRQCPRLLTFTAIFNGVLGDGFLFLGTWVLRERHHWPLSSWMVPLNQGFTWLFITFVISFKGDKFIISSLRFLSIFAFFYAVLSSFSSIYDDATPVKGEVFRLILDVLMLPGSLSLLYNAYRGYISEDPDESALLGDEKGSDSSGFGKKAEFESRVSPFARAGLFSKLSFWWLNPLMKRGTEKTIAEEDMQALREEDRAEACYASFLQKLDEQQSRPRESSQPPFLRAITLCIWKDVLISGLFAFVKIIALSAGPLLLNLFILVAEGRSSFRNQGPVLAILLILAKITESLSQRQWYFRSRLVGLRVRSLLTAAIYKKQLRLNNSSRLIHSSGKIMNYATIDAYRIGEFLFSFHQLWTTSLQLLIALVIIFRSVRLATFSAMIAVILTVLCNVPLAKLQQKYQTRLMAAKDERLKACNEALTNMKVLKLYAWDAHFQNVIEKLRYAELKPLKSLHMRRACNSFLFFLSPVLISAVTFATCYFLRVPLTASTVFMFVATLRLVQEPLVTIPEVLGSAIQAKVAFGRITEFLEASELRGGEKKRRKISEGDENAIVIKSASFSWDEKSLPKPNLRNVNLEVKFGEKVAICGEVGSGKSTLLASILGETPCVQGTIDVYGRIAYVSQTAWIQSATIRDNILFGRAMDEQRYRETIRICCLEKDLEAFPSGDKTEIGEKGITLSGGQKQRVQLARALYQDADIYLLDDPFSAVDAQTATSLFNEYVMRALADKAVLLVTHQVDFLPAFDSVLLMSDGEIVGAAKYQELLSSSREFQDLVNAHAETAGSRTAFVLGDSKKQREPAREINKISSDAKSESPKRIRLIKQEEREKGDNGLKPYRQYLGQNKSYVFFFAAALFHLMFAVGQILQNSWMAANVDNLGVSSLKLMTVYVLIGLGSIMFLLIRSPCLVSMSERSSASLFTQLQNSLFRAPMSFYDSTPLGRILSRVASDLSIADLDVPIGLTVVLGTTTNTLCNLGVLAVVTWPVLFVSVPMVILVLHLQKYYFAAAKELMRLEGTTRSLVASHLAESMAGITTIRALEDEERFFNEYLKLVDTNASPFFHSFAAKEWLILRLEALCAVVLASAAFCIVLLPPGTFSPGFVGMALSYGLALNIGLVFAIQSQCQLTNSIVSVERLNQYMSLPSEAPLFMEANQPPPNWPDKGGVEISDLQVRYRPNMPLVLKGVSCTFKGGHKIGIVGRTGSGKTTLICSLFRLVEPSGGRIVVDGIDIAGIGLHDLRSRLGIIPQDPTLFNGTVRYNLDPLCHHTDAHIWEVLGKCQLREVVQEKEGGLDSLVEEDGSNWSVGQRQLFCLGRALLRRSRVLVLDEATASIDNATDSILQRTIRAEFADCTIITVAHRIPTVMDCNMVLSISDGLVVEYDEPTKLMKKEGSLFRQLVEEYWSHYHSAESHLQMV